MAATVPYDGRVRFHQCINNFVPDWYIQLIVNCDDLTEASVIGDIVAAAFSGYGDLPPNPDAVAFDAVTNKAYIQCAPANFAHNGGILSNVVNGWALVDFDNGILMAFEPLAPKTMAASGDTITVTAKITLTQE